MGKPRVKAQPQPLAISLRHITTGAKVRGQARCALTEDCRSCGCEELAVAPHCDPSYPLRTRDPAAPDDGGRQGSSSMSLGAGQR